MGLLGNISGPLRKRPSSNPFTEYFEATIESEDFAFFAALDALDSILKQATGDEELITLLLEECIYSALLATHNENLILGLKNDPQSMDRLLKDYEYQTTAREQMITKHVVYHSDYINNFGFCDGCDQCRYHPDVNDLITPWSNKDLNFFINLYVGMCTINFAFDQVIFELIPNSPKILVNMDQPRIQEFRLKVFELSEKLYQELS